MQQIPATLKQLNFCRALKVQISLRAEVHFLTVPQLMKNLSTSQKFLWLE